MILQPSVDAGTDGVAAFEKSRSALPGVGTGWHIMTGSIPVSGSDRVSASGSSDHRHYRVSGASDGLQSPGDRQ